MTKKYLKLDKDVKEWIAKVERATNKMVTKKILKKASKPMLKTQKRLIAIHANKTLDRPDPYFIKRKGFKGKKYYKGNLRRSIRTISFKKDKTGVYVGPRFSKKGGPFRGNSVDGFYARFVNDGAAGRPGIFYVEKSIVQTKNRVQRIIKEEAFKALRKGKMKQGIA